MSEELDNFLEQHKDNYKKAVLDNIKNNTDALVDQDITSLLKKPPLDSMDSVKTKFFDLAKKNKIVLNDEELTKLLDNYRKKLLKKCVEMKKIRISSLSNVVNGQKLIKNTDIIKINKKDFAGINKDIRKILKDSVVDDFQNNVLKKLDVIFLDNTSDTVCSKIKEDMFKYIKGNYQKQLFENFDIKIMVKDTTLINSTKEQAERYLFTLNNSRLLNDFNK